MTPFLDTLSHYVTLRSGVAAAAFVALLGGTTPCAAEPIQKRAQMQISVTVSSACTITPGNAKDHTSVTVSCLGKGTPTPMIEESEVFVMETEQGPTPVIITSVMF